jgi:hypothetical protein
MGSIEGKIQKTSLNQRRIWKGKRRFEFIRNQMQLHWGKSEWKEHADDHSIFIPCCFALIE